jgi:dolichyl-phosphate-mannose--protein O-mannosyl transferase
MFNYHEGVSNPKDPGYKAHPYAASWGMWLGNVRPMLFYANYQNEWDSAKGEWVQTRSAFASFNNPLISWAGLAALIAVLVSFVMRPNFKAFFIVVGYMSQFLPWLAVPRETYAYHYFPSVIFLILAICYLFHEMLESDRRYSAVMWTFVGVAGLLFVMFLPVLIGIPVPEWYAVNFLRWLPFNVWPF